MGHRRANQSDFPFVDGNMSMFGVDDDGGLARPCEDTQGKFVPPHDGFYPPFNSQPLGLIDFSVNNYVRSNVLSADADYFPFF